MLAAIATLACSTFATLGALSRVRAVAHATAYDPVRLTKAIAAGGSTESLGQLAELQSADDADQTWEGELLRALVGARTEEEARAGANEVLLDVEARLTWGAHIPAACARISLFGALLAGVLLLMRDVRLTAEVLDVIALGGAGAMISMVAGAEAQKMAKRMRKAVDALVDAVMKARGFEQEPAGPVPSGSAQREQD